MFLKIVEESARIFPEIELLGLANEVRTLAQSGTKTESVDLLKSRGLIYAQGLRVDALDTKIRTYDTPTVKAEFMADRPPFLATNDMPILIDGVQLPNATYVSEITSPRHITQTASQGNDGNANVIETSSLMNAQFSLKGVATAYETGEKGYPFQWLDIFLNLTKKNKYGLEIENKILNRLGISYVVFKSVKIIPKVGTLDFFAFDISCISDNSPELELWNQEEQNQDIANEETNNEPDFTEENLV